MSDKFHKVSNKGMDQFFDPVGDEQTPTYILSSHQEIDMIENSINNCVGCDNSMCTCEGMVISPIGVTPPNDVFSSHQKIEMLKMNKAIIKTELETVDSDKSLKASYTCGKDGLTTLVPLGTPVATIRCLSCNSAKFMSRNMDDLDNELGGQVTQEKNAQRKPQFRQHLKYDPKINDFRLVWAPDDDRGLGSFDPWAVLGYSQPKAVMEAYNNHYAFIDRNSGKWVESDKSIMESLIERVHDQRIMEDDVFAKDPNASTSVLVPCDVPQEMKVDIMNSEHVNGRYVNNKGMESFYMDVPELTRRVKVLVNLPENKAETYKRLQRESTRNNIIDNKAKKTNRILSVDQTINNQSINTANKYVGAKPRPENTTTELLGKHQKALFWASTPESKLAIKQATSAKTVNSVLVPQPDKVKEFQKAMQYIMTTTVEVPRIEIPVTAKSDKKAYSNVSFMNEDSIFENIETGYPTESLIFNIYDYEPATTSVNTPIVKSDMPKPIVAKPSTNSNSIQQHLSRLSKSAQCESLIKYMNKLSQQHQKPKSNDNSSVVAKKATPSLLSNNQINIIPSHQKTDMKQIFVFGSNLLGIHGAGSAKSAKDNHGAIQGQGKGLQNNACAFPTKNTPYEKMSYDDLKIHAKEFVECVKAHPELQFNMTRIGCGFAGFTPAQVAPLLKELVNCKNVNWEMAKDFLPYIIETDMKTCTKCNTVLKYDICEKCTDTARQEILNDMKVKLAIVGASKANPSAYQAVYDCIKSEMDKVGKNNLEIVSGGASGIDSIAEQVAKDLDLPTKVYLPKTNDWNGFKARNLEIAEYSTKVVSFANKFTTKKCYHCERVGKDNNHEKTAGCFTGYHHGEYETIVLN